MKRLVIFLLGLLFFSSCEKEADPIEFISTEAIDEALRRENSIEEVVAERITASNENPILVGMANNTPFNAVVIDATSLRFTSEPMLTITLVDTQENQLTLIIPNPQTRTYGIDLPGAPPFSAEYINVSTGEAFLTTLNNDTNKATGTLMLDFDTQSEDSPVISLQFEFKAFVETASDMPSGRFVEFNQGNIVDVVVR